MEEGLKFTSPEEEIRYLENKILEKKKEMITREPRSLVDDAIREHTGHASPAAVPAEPLSKQLPADLLEKDVALLITVAFEHGIQEAVRRARETHNPHLIDAFHDALVDRFFSELVKRNLIVPHE